MASSSGFLTLLARAPTHRCPEQPESVNVKHFAPAFCASLVLLVLSTDKARPIPAVSELGQRELLFLGNHNIIDIRQLHDEGSLAFARDFDFSDLSLHARNLEKVFEASAEVEIRGMDLI